MGYLRLTPQQVILGCFSSSAQLHVCSPILFWLWLQAEPLLMHLHSSRCLITEDVKDKNFLLFPWEWESVSPLEIIRTLELTGPILLSFETKKRIKGMLSNVGMKTLCSSRMADSSKWKCVKRKQTLGYKTSHNVGWLKVNIALCLFPFFYIAQDSRWQRCCKIN